MLLEGSYVIVNIHLSRDVTLVKMVRPAFQTLGLVAGCFEHGNELLVSMKVGNFF